MSAYRYSPLTLTTSIRVIQLLPEAPIPQDDKPPHSSDPPKVEGEASSIHTTSPTTIHCRLLEYDLRNPSVTSHPYEALSYVWGSEKTPLSILVDGCSLAVTRNLQTALVRLRDPTCPRTLWIDALCIDQANEAEKAQQIGLMREVYAKATRVLVWLGEDEVGGVGEMESDGETLEVIRRAGESLMLPLSERDPPLHIEVVQQQRQSVSSEGIKRLLQRPWFRRIWVLQEMASARSIVMLCGAMEIEGFAFATGLDALSAVISGPIPPVVALIKGAMFRPRCSSLHDGKALLERSDSLGELVDNYHEHEASRLHDKVYALMGICRDDLTNAGLEPNYALPWKTLFYRLIRLLLGHVSIQTWDDRQAALIVSKGCVIGRVSKVEGHFRPNFGQSIEANFQNMKNKEHPQYWRGCARWTLLPSAKAVQVDDIICLLQNASRPAIVRCCREYFAIISCVVIPPTDLYSVYEESGEKSEETFQLMSWDTLPRPTFQTYEFPLLWTWEALHDGQNNFESSMSFPQKESASPAPDDDTKRTEWAEMQIAARHWQIGLLLEKCGEYELAMEKRQLAIEEYQSITQVQLVDTEMHHYSMPVLCWAARCGHDALVKKLLTYSAEEINSKDNELGATPFMWAAEYGHVPVLRTLLSFGKLDVNSVNIHSETPLTKAAKRGHVAVVQFLLDHPDTDLDTKDDRGLSPLAWAARSGHGVVVKLLLATGRVDPNAKGGKYERTVLMMGAAGGHIAVVELLLAHGCSNVESGAVSSSQESRTGVMDEEGTHQDFNHARNQSAVDVSTKDVRGFTALMLAARYGHEEVVRRLVKVCSNDIEAKDARIGHTALSYAARNGHDTVVELLVGAEADPHSTSNMNATPLLWAARGGHVEVVKRLTKLCSINDIQAKDWLSGETALAAAAQCGHGAVVEELLHGGADVKAVDITGKTPLILAACWGNEDAIDRLLRVGKADIDRADDISGRTPLHWAIAEQQTGVAKQLMAFYHPDVNLKSKDGMSALSHARGNTEIMKMILARGDIEVDSISTNGKTALLWAAEKGHAEAVRLLLATGKADIHHRDKKGSSALMCAVWSGDVATVKVLLEAGSDINAKDWDNGHSALHLATCCGLVSIVQVLLERSDIVVLTRGHGNVATLDTIMYNHYETVVELVKAYNKRLQSPITLEANQNSILRLVHGGQEYRDMSDDLVGAVIPPEVPRQHFQGMDFRDKKVVWRTIEL